MGCDWAVIGLWEREIGCGSVGLSCSVGLGCVIVRLGCECVIVRLGCFSVGLGVVVRLAMVV